MICERFNGIGTKNKNARILQSELNMLAKQKRRERVRKKHYDELDFSGVEQEMSEST